MWAFYLLNFSIKNVYNIYPECISDALQIGFESRAQYFQGLSEKRERVESCRNFGPNLRSSAKHFEKISKLLPGNFSCKSQQNLQWCFLTFPFLRNSNPHIYNCPNPSRSRIKTSNFPDENSATLRSYTICHSHWLNSSEKKYETTNPKSRQTLRTHLHFEKRESLDVFNIVKRRDSRSIGLRSWCA